MKGNQITDHYNNHPVLNKLIDAINEDKSENFHLEGLSGSSRSTILSLVFHKTQTTHLVIIPEKEDAAYFYNDLISLLGEESVFFFPSTYKLSLIHISEPTRRTPISYAVFCLKKKKQIKHLKF